jgi:hypothetical protein
MNELKRQDGFRHPAFEDYPDYRLLSLQDIELRRIGRIRVGELIIAGRYFRG